MNSRDTLFLKTFLLHGVRESGATTSTPPLQQAHYTYIYILLCDYFDEVSLFVSQESRARIYKYQNKKEEEVVKKKKSSSWGADEVDWTKLCNLARAAAAADSLSSAKISRWLGMMAIEQHVKFNQIIHNSLNFY